MTTTPEAASPLPLKGAPLAAWQSQIRGGRLDHATSPICICI
jgi:hypothetical protein